MKKILRILLHCIVFVVLTASTQIGGIVYIISTIVLRKTTTKKYVKRTGLFIGLYLCATLFIVPYIAPFFGRERIKESEFVEARSFIFKIANRNYVRPELNEAMTRIAEGFGRHNKGIKIMYLDANFPFLNGFPLLPHLSHNDGKKVDISLMYETKTGELTNKKPSISGYGVFEASTTSEYNQNIVCKEQGNWQYDFPKYLTLGRINKEIEFSKKGTQELAVLILRQKEIGKLFIEPHLKKRLHLTNEKVRFHGCQAVRHDDHIHFQLR